PPRRAAVQSRQASPVPSCVNGPHGPSSPSTNLVVRMVFSLDETLEERKMAPRKLVLVGEGRDLGDSRKRRVAPPFCGCAEPAQAALQESPEQLGEPSRSGQRVLEACTPVAGAQSAVTCHAPADARPSVEIQG